MVGNDVLDDSGGHIVENKCVFCRLARKYVNRKLLKLSMSNKKELKDKIKLNATHAEDQHMLNTMNDLQDGDPVYYHKACQIKYYTNFSLAYQRVENSEWHASRNIYERVLDEIYLLVSETVIKKRGIVLFQFVYDCARSLLEKEYNAAFGTFDSTFNPSKLLGKLMAHFKSEIQIITKDKMKIIASADRLDVSSSQVNELLERERILQVGLLVRKEIYSIKKKPLPANLTATDVINGECPVIPPKLHQVVQAVICGNDPRSVKSEGLQRKVNSMCYDFIHNATHGAIKTCKHMTLGVAMKSMTSSRQVVDVLNKYGHVSSYHVVEELETEATYTSTSRSVLCPDDIELSPEFFTGLAFDNFDRFTETSSGKDTLHDTVGIIYQNDFRNRDDLKTLLSDDIARLMSEYYPEYSRVEIDDPTSLRNNDTESVSTPPLKRRRFQAEPSQIEDYVGRPKLKARLIPVDDELRKIDDTSFKFARMSDKCWLFSKFYQVPRTPMWVGFNNLVVIDDSIKQRVSYLTPINESPTGRHVVAATLQMSEDIAKECKQPEIQVTYDLAIAKIGYQIQNHEKLKAITHQTIQKYSKIFIHMGGFHTEAAYFKAMGKFIDGCGLTHMMVESQLLAPGSVNGFITGKHFNRCRKLHPIASLAIQILHFQSFLNINKIEISDDLMTIITTLKNKKIDQDFFEKPENVQLNDLINKYEKYVEETLNGNYGYTPQYYLMYVEHVNNYQTFSRSIRMGDFDMYKLMIDILCDLFFVFNLVNYCRWILWYLDQLLKVSTTHPYVAYQLSKGFFGVKRTDKAFSKMPIDLTLEQTYNADAGRRLTGINCFTNSISARQKWSKSHCFRSTLTTHAYTVAGIKKKQDTTADLEPHNIIKSNNRTKNLVDTIQKNMNPFDPELDKLSLYNISTGKAASPEVSNFLLNANSSGKKLKNDFISACSVSEDRFEQSIKLNKILNFVSGNKKQTVKVNDKEKCIKMQRDLFGRILMISLKDDRKNYRKPDLPKILSFPLTPVPNNFCHLDGTIYSTQKSALLKCIVGEEDSTSTKNLECDVMMIDGFFFLHTLRDIADQTYSKISTSILKKVVAYKANTIHLIFDQYFFPSIKDYERNKRGSPSEKQYKIAADMRLNSTFSVELRNSNFKKAFLEFLIENWKLDEKAEFFENKTVLLNYDECHEYKAVVDSNNKKSVSHSINTIYTAPRHEEADTRIVYSVSKLNFDGKVIIKCDDTDIFIILLGNMHKLKHNLEIFLLFGVSKYLRLINVTEIYSELGERLCKALPGFHAFTGCDYNPSFFMKGKQRPYAILKKCESFQTAFFDLTDESMDTQKVFDVMEDFVCRMYSQKKCVRKVNEARLAIINKKYDFDDTDESFDKLDSKSIDSTMLPPCQRELYQHFLRSHFIACTWGNADLIIPNETITPEQCGWKKENSTFEFVWFEGPQWPARIKDVIINAIAEDDGTFFFYLHSAYRYIFL